MVNDASSAASPDVVVIEPPRGWVRIGLRDLWLHRELLYFLAWRDVKVRYAQAAIGFAWAVLQPLLMMTIFTVFLGRLAKVPSDGIPYPVFALAGLVPWTYFANAVGGATDSLVTSSNLVSKVYFPRLVVPFAALLAWLPDLAIGSVLLVGVALIYGISPSVSILLIPLFGGLALLAAASVSIWLSALNVTYRDVRYAVPFLLQLWLFATPVVYPSSLVPERWRPVFGLNPMAGVVEGFRWCLLRQAPPNWCVMAVSLAATTTLLMAGLYNFRRVEHRFADVI
ncbi:MAG: ABC transporter permease [Acidimicrobiales bacterium]